MPLYEVVLRYPDREEVRLTDQPLSIGKKLDVAGKTWEVVWEREPDDVRATARFLCELTVSQRARARRMRAGNEEMHAGATELRARLRH